MTKVRYTATWRRVAFFAALAGISYLVSYLHRTQVFTIHNDVLTFLRFTLTFALTFFVASILVRVTAPAITRAFDSNVAKEQVLIARKLYTLSIYFVALLFVLWQFGATLESLAVTLGLFATGIAFALREILLSYFVWFILLTKKPFRMGDYIRIGDDEGVVVHIGTFYVVLDDTPERKDDYVRVPNKTFLEKSISNLGRNNIRTIVSVPIPENAKKLQAKIGTLNEMLSMYNEFSGVTVERRGEKLQLTCSVVSSLPERKAVVSEITLKMLETLS